MVGQQRLPGQLVRVQGGQFALTVRFKDQVAPGVELKNAVRLQDVPGLHRDLLRAKAGAELIVRPDHLPISDRGQDRQEGGNRDPERDEETGTLHE